MTDVFCKDCKWMDRSGSLGNGTACHHPASLVTGPDLVIGRWWGAGGGGYMTACDMRSGQPMAWRQTYCGLDGTLFEPLEPSGDE